MSKYGKNVGGGGGWGGTGSYAPDMTEIVDFKSFLL